MSQEQTSESTTELTTELTTEPTSEPTVESTPQVTPEQKVKQVEVTQQPSAPVPNPAVLARPRPGPGPGRPGPGRPGTGATSSPAGSSPTGSAPVDSAFGRVGEDGTVYVRTPDGEREVGSYPGASAQDALTYFGRKYDEIVAQIDLFEQRLTATDVPIGEIDSGLAKLRSAVSEPRAVGDLTALTDRVAALAPVAAERRQHAEAVRRAARDEARARRLAIVEEAETIAAVAPERTQWRAEGQRMKDLFDLWRAEQKSATAKGAGHSAEAKTEEKTDGSVDSPAVRLDRRSEDELWKRFSHARTAFDRKRRQYFAHLDEEHTQARATKEKLIKEAEALRSSTDWGPTAAAYKRLMDQWRTAGRAARKEDDELWERFRGAQDTFFAARHAVQAEQEAEFTANLQVKNQLLIEAEQLVPVQDLAKAKARLRDIQDRWEAAGKVPRAEMERVERRLRAVEQEVRAKEEARWSNTNPEARARAQSAVDQLETVIADLEADLRKATEQGKAKRVADAQAGLSARREWLEQARKALADFGG